MPHFSQQPLTWLFLIATACIDLVAITRVLDHGSNWFGAIALGQMWLTGTLLTAGRTHRLLRAALFVIVPVFLTIPDYLAGMHPFSGGNSRTSAVAPYVLGMSFVLTAYAAILSLLIIAINTLVLDKPDKVAKTKFQFPIVEFFGWTIVVALATLALQVARFIGMEFGTLANAAALAMFPATYIVYVYATPRTWFLKAALLVGAAISALTLALDGARFEGIIFIGSYAFLGAWVAVRSMDNGLCRRPASGAWPGQRMLETVSAAADE